MPVKMFWSICGAVALVAVLLWITGNFTMLAATVFGFIAFGLTFMGMMNVLPISISHPPTPKVAEPQSVELRAGQAKPASAFGTWKSA